MHSDRLWLITVAIGFSALLITTYFVMMPITDKESFLKRTDSGLSGAIDRFEHLKEENRNPKVTNSST